LEDEQQLQSVLGTPLHWPGVTVVVGAVTVDVASSQQSELLAQLLPVDEKSVLQLLFPQVKLPAQCESKSQSPPPLLHWLEAEQQLQSVVGTPLHCPAGGAMVVGVVVPPEVSSQQSALLAQLLPDNEKSFLQLLLPQVKLPAQCESTSQSPPPTLHWLVSEQQLQSVLGTPLHWPGGGRGVVAVAPVSSQQSAATAQLAPGELKSI
jgi:hypothetical protein